MMPGGLWRCMAAVAVMLLAYLPSAAQHEEGNIQRNTDTTSLRYSLRKGTWDAHFRLYYMATDNEKQLSDYYALAFGGGIRYETGAYKGFRLGVGGFFTWNLTSSDLAAPDPTTGAKNRYEIGQFDIENPENRNDLDRLEDFYLSYEHRGWKVTLGKQVIKSPFVNPQDGRMRPTGQEGLWGYWKPGNHWKLEGGWLTKISPRGTVRWFDVDESIGVYPSGVNVYGEKSDYAGNLSSAGIGILGLHYTEKEAGLHIQFWDHFTEGIFNTALFQADLERPVGSLIQAIGGFQYTFQHPIGDGGNADPRKTYFDPGQRAQVISVRAGLRKQHTELLLNATRITADGRFLMPREWGREPLYTFLPRERNEGSGDVIAFTANLVRRIPRQRIRAELSYGYYDLPDPLDARLNKYQFPSYHHFLADVRYQFRGFLDGLNIQALYVYKLSAGGINENPKFVINKVNMHHFNLIINYLL